MKRFFLPLIYARRELRSGLRGFYIFLLCLVMGVGAITAVQSLSLGLYETIRYNGRLILGADIALRTEFQPATKEQVDFLRRKAGVLAIVMETRSMILSQDGEKSSLVEVKAVDPFYPFTPVSRLQAKMANNWIRRCKTFYYPKAAFQNPA